MHLLQEKPPETWFFSPSKELQISQSIIVQAGFVGGTFSWKRAGLAQVGEKGKSKGGKSKRDPFSEDLHSWQDGGG